MPPSFTLNNLKKKLAKKYTAAKPSEPHNWSLSHHLFRSLPVSGNPAGSQKFHDDLQVISLSAYPSHGFVHSSTVSRAPNQTSESAAAEEITHGTTVALPSSESCTTLVPLLAQKLNTVWQPVKNQSLEIPNGRAWDLGIFNLVAGEVIASGTSTRQSRGMVLAVKLNPDFEHSQEKNKSSQSSPPSIDETQMDSLDSAAGEEVRNEKEGNTKFLIQEFASILGIDALPLDVPAGSAGHVVKNDTERAVEQFWQIASEDEDHGFSKHVLQCVPDGSILWGPAKGWESQVELWAKVMGSKNLVGALGRRT